MKRGEMPGNSPANLKDENLDGPRPVKVKKEKVINKLLKESRGKDLFLGYSICLCHLQKQDH